jgi:hypothetical protein
MHQQCNHAFAKKRDAELHELTTTTAVEDIRDPVAQRLEHFHFIFPTPLQVHEYYPVPQLSDCQLPNMRPNLVAITLFFYASLSSSSPIVDSPFPKCIGGPAAKHHGRLPCHNPGAQACNGALVVSYSTHLSLSCDLATTINAASRFKSRN